VFNGSVLKNTLWSKVTGHLEEHGGTTGHQGRMASVLHSSRFGVYILRDSAMKRNLFVKHSKAINKIFVMQECYAAAPREGDKNNS